MKRSFAKMLIPFIIFINIIFTGAVLYVFLQTGAEPATLVVSWFAFTTGELWLLATIKKTKLKRGGKTDDC